MSSRFSKEKYILMNLPENKFDKTNAFIAFGVYLIAFIVYALTVQPTFSFWDCGEFIASSAILGIPHPPGTPLYILIGRIASMIPFVDDVSLRINYLSVIFSAATALFSYLLTVRIVRYFFAKDDNSSLNSFIIYIGGIAGALFVAFSQTNWANSVEAEVYGMGLALSVMLVWLSLIYFEHRGSISAAKIMILAFYIALLGVGVHMTVFLVVPVCSIFFLLKKEATNRDWLVVCGFLIVELLLIVFFSNMSNADSAGTLFKFISGVLALVVVAMIYKKINWAILIAIASVSTVMMSFLLYFEVVMITIPLLLILGYFSEKNKWYLQWKNALMIVMIALIGVSVHLYIPIRSELNPRIDENNPSRGFPGDWTTFINFLDRKQYGQVSMVDRMFNRRGAWENQLGRHPHMGFWSYFEEQYSKGGNNFIPFLALGLIGLIAAIRKRLEIGLPFLTLFLLCSLGLVLYMNFADGTMYNPQTQDAYLEVRNRDYFFTPAFVFFGIAMGIGLSTIMLFVKNKLAASGESKMKMAVYATSLLVFLPVVSLAHNYHTNDRSNNYIPYYYAKNLLDTCEQNAILFTSGDNDTFPLWCLQETYGYRKDVVVVNLSLLNTDWYIEQMKNRYGVPISLTDEQILWYQKDRGDGFMISTPKEPFIDKPRKRRAYLTPSMYGGRLVKVQDMMVDEIVIENKWKRPIYFSSPPYAQSPLNLKDRVAAHGLLYKLERNPVENLIDSDIGFDNFMNKYTIKGYENADVFRDENATGVFLSVGVNGVRIYDDLIRKGDTTRAMQIAEKVIEVYPEYWQTYILLADIYKKRGDSTKAEALLYQLHDTLEIFLESNPQNIFYRQDLGLAKLQIAKFNDDLAMKDEGLNLLWQGFKENPNSNYAFRKLITALSQNARGAEMVEAAKLFGEYKINRNDPIYQQIMGVRGGQ